MKRTPRKFYFLMICVVLAVATGSLYWQVQGFDFVNYDDQAYVEDNEIVRKGLTREGFVWAFTTDKTGYWHPLTWLSLMLDCELARSVTRTCHTTNVLIHIANTLLLFWVLRRMTSALWCSAFVAVLFALHPLHVESVAWISERKDVLSTFFFFLTMLFYVHYVERPGFLRYVPIALCFAIGLLAKPMLVTLPCVLLLLDYWPLGRLRPGQLLGKGKEGEGARKAAVRLMAEKIPLFILTAALSIVTYLLQKSGQVVADLEFGVRLSNAIASYGRYIGKMFWPSGLTVIYLHSERIEVLPLVVSSIVLVCVSVVIILQVRRRPYLAMGWLWYIGLLVPVIGLVQVGNQAMADRYTYVPLVGLFIMLTWGAADVTKGLRYRRNTLGVVGVSIILVLSVCTGFQIQHWQNGVTLFGHAVDVTKGNYLAHSNFGVALKKVNRDEDAIEQWKISLQIKPDFDTAIGNLGPVLVENGRVEEAVFYYREFLELAPDDCRTQINMADALSRLKVYDQAVEHYELALLFGCDSVGIHYNLAMTLSNLGRYDEAILHYSKFLEQRPDSFRAHNNLGALLLAMRNDDEAIKHFQEALRLNWNYLGAHMNLAMVLMDRGGIYEAILHYEEAVRINPNDRTAQKALKKAKEMLAMQNKQDK